ncbi:MAG TPA: DUF378 domain-containing protein [Candidatus Paceibacterota bacterium]|nr:DUF378 domain-containing protein [Candidatus Paceibacterota bacterium]
MKGWNGIVCILVVVGAINWGLVGLGMLFGGSDWNVVKLIFGTWQPVEAIIYVLVGIAGIMHIKSCRANSGSMMM